MQTNDEIAAFLKKSLDGHGYSFQYAVIKKAEEMFKQKQTKWVFHGAEYPVESPGKPSHIDFLLRDSESMTYLVAECKRAEPAKANWCFVRAPYTWRSLEAKYVQIDKIIQSTFPGKIFRNLTTALLYTDAPIAHLGMEIKTGQKVDGKGGTEFAINDALGQALRNTAGLLDKFYKTLPEIERDRSLTHLFIPVIFTTAKLYLTDADISGADLMTGMLEPDSVQVNEIDWLWFNQNRGYSISPETGLSSTNKNFPMPEVYEYLRSVIIVGASGIESFLKANLAQWIKDRDF